MTPALRKSRFVAALLACCPILFSQAGAALATDFRQTATVCNSLLADINEYGAALRDIGWQRIAPDALPAQSRHVLAVIDSMNELSQELGDAVHSDFLAARRERVDAQIVAAPDFVAYFVSANGSEHDVLRVILESTGRALCWSTGNLSDNADWLQELSETRALRRDLTADLSPDERVVFELVTSGPLAAPNEQIRLRSTSIARLSTEKISQLLNAEFQSDFVLHTAILAR